VISISDFDGCNGTLANCPEQQNSAPSFGLPFKTTPFSLVFLRKPKPTLVFLGGGVFYVVFSSLKDPLTNGMAFTPTVPPRRVCPIVEGDHVGISFSPPPRFFLTPFSSTAATFSPFPALPFFFRRFIGRKPTSHPRQKRSSEVAFVPRNDSLSGFLPSRSFPSRPPYCFPPLQVSHFSLWIKHSLGKNKPCPSTSGVHWDTLASLPAPALFSAAVFFLRRTLLAVFEC